MNRHTPRAVLFGPARYGGIEIPELFTDQGIGQLKLLFGHTKLRDQVGQQIFCFLSELQLFIGSISPVLSLPYKVYGKLVGDYWLTIHLETYVSGGFHRGNRGRLDARPVSSE
jgi:hypothetical protein